MYHKSFHLHMSGFNWVILKSRLHLAVFIHPTGDVQVMNIKLSKNDGSELHMPTLPLLILIMIFMKTRHYLVLLVSPGIQSKAHEHHDKETNYSPQSNCYLVRSATCCHYLPTKA